MDTEADVDIARFLTHCVVLPKNISLEDSKVIESLQ